MSKSYDLSTSTKWANLADGDHVVKLRAKGAGYGSSSFSNSVTVTKGSAMPVKGDLITIESKQYRVLKTNGSVAEVLAMYDVTNSQVFGTDNTYAGSALDTYCNSTFYGTLSTAMKNAIVEKTFKQDSWHFSWDVGTTLGSPKYIGYASDNDDYELSLVTAEFGTSISRKCYALSVQDVIDYLEVTPSMTAADTTLNPTNIWMMFWNQTASPGSIYSWLCSTNSYARTSFYARGSYGDVVDYSVDAIRGVRPAFQIDLSKIEWTPVGGGN